MCSFFLERISKMNENLKKLAEIKTLLIDDLKRRIPLGNLDAIEVLSEAIYCINKAERMEMRTVREIIHLEMEIQNLEEKNKKF